MFAITYLGVRVCAHDFRRMLSVHFFLPKVPRTSSQTGNVLLASKALPLHWPKVTGVLTTVPATTMGGVQMGKYNSELLEQGRWTPPAFLFSSSCCCWPAEMAERREIQICCYNLWKAQPVADQKHWFVALEKGNIDGLSSELPPPRIFPIFKVKPSLH